MWVCRSGKDSKYFNKFVKDKRIYLAWDGYFTDLSNKKTIEDFRNLVVEERNPESFTTISNWAGQLKAFCVDMKIDDYVLVPSIGSRSFMLCRIAGNYEFLLNSILPHSRKIEIVKTNVPRAIFPQTIQYSLGAFRTIFKVRQEDMVLENIFKAE